MQKYSFLPLNKKVAMETPQTNNSEIKTDEGKEQ